MSALRIATLIGVATTLVALTGTPAAAERLGGVTMPGSVRVDGETLVLNGMGKRQATFLKVDVYVAGLYLTERSSDPDEILDLEGPKHLRLKFVRDVDRKDITEAWTAGFRKNAADDLAALNDRIAQLNDWMTGMNDGDTLAFTYVPGRGTFVQVDGETKGVIEGEDFAQALLSIWLGPKPPNSGLKKGLLGRN